MTVSDRPTTLTESPVTPGSQPPPSTTTDHTSSTPNKTSHPFHIRRAGINLNHWYAVALSSELADAPLAITLWHQPIVLYRDSQNQVQAIEDRCPHRQVKLSHGCIVGDTLECAYHGWRFDGDGRCTAVPYLTQRQRLPGCSIRSYPAREENGFIWLFPGDPIDAQTSSPLPLPEWDHLNYIVSVTPIDTQAHFSYLIENLMDMYHGHLHKDLQAWADPVLADLNSSNGRVDAHYDAKSYYKIDKIYSISQLLFPALRRLHPEPLDVSYIYPHWVSTLGKDFKIVCLFAPISETHTRAFLIHFTSLHAFLHLHKLPKPFRRWVKTLCFNAARGLLAGLVEQDILMIEEEQQSFNNHPERKNFELNPTIGAVQRLIRQQAEL